MKLVIHAGTHKTATTPFQRMCCSARSLFAGSRFFYPDFVYRGVNAFQHGYLVWDLEAGLRSSVFASLCGFYEKGMALGCRSVFLSGEDFENFLVDSSAQAQFECMAFDAGSEDLEWVFVRLPAVDYFRFIYSELSKQAVCICPLSAASAVVRAGWFAVSTANLNYFFAIDLSRLLGVFDARSKGRARVFEFDKFVSGRCLGDLFLFESFGFICSPVMDAHLEFAKRSKNAGLSVDLVESNYLANFLGSVRSLGDLEMRFFEERGLVARRASFDAALAMLDQHFSNK